MDSRPGTDRSADLGGDPVCWLHRVCPECGRFAEDEDLDACPECGAELSD